jgi:tyrosyl-tRNA synthetase
MVSVDKDIEHRMNRICEIGEEVTTNKELRNLLSHFKHSKKRPLCYGGFEPSGKIHIAQGCMMGHYIRTMVESGCDVIIWIADLFAMLNNKLGGDMEKIRTCGEYMIEVWTVYLKNLNVDMKHVKFLWASEEIAKDPDRYWRIVMYITTKFNISRFKKCTPILGRNEVEKERSKLLKLVKLLENQGKYQEACGIYKDLVRIEENHSQPLSYLMYAAMQCADIYFLNVDICQLGMDQRKVNMLARELSDYVFADKPSFIETRCKPIIVSHHMLMGLQQSIGDGNDSNKETQKMSKSIPDSAIFMDDSVQDVNRKIKKGFCRTGNVDVNPVLEYLRYIVLPINGSIVIQKPEKYGGERYEFTIENYHELVALIRNEEIHPSELKSCAKNAINEMLVPLRTHFKEDKKAKKLVDTIKSWKNLKK